jgi:two-component system chemotaxis sensor kinase CheA
MNEGMHTGPEAGARRVKFPLIGKLVALTLAVTACGSLISGVLVDANLYRTTLAAFEDRLSSETTMLGQMTASALFGEVDPTDTSLDEPVRALGEAVHTRLSVIARDGTVVADSDSADRTSLGSQAGAVEIVMARGTGEGHTIRGNRMFVARAIVRDGVLLGFARSSIAMAEVNARVQAMRLRIAFGSALALLVAVAVGVVFSSRIVGPIRALSLGARQVGGGDFDHEISIQTGDEIGELAASFNEMTFSLRRTIARLDARNDDMRLVLDHMGQGLLTIERSGRMSIERSAALERWFGPSHHDETFAEYIGRVDPVAAADFAMQFEELLEAVLPLRLLVEQLPKRLAQGGRAFELSYAPIMATEIEAGQRVAKLLVVISDITAREAVEHAEAEQRDTVNIFECIARNKAGVIEFVADAGARVQALTAQTPMPPAEAQRYLHTLKGNSAVFGLRELATLCHRIEGRLADSTGDLSPDDRRVLHQAWTRTSDRISAFLGDRPEDEVVLDGHEYAALLDGIAGGSPRAHLIHMVQEFKFDRVHDRLAHLGSHARDLATRLEKCPVKVEVDDTDLRLPRETWRPFWAAFVHVVRNAVDHGLESEDERARAHKPVPAVIRLAVARRGEHVVIEVTDDGRGIDWQQIAARAREGGRPADRMQDWVEAMFSDGLSAKESVSEVSGRGVGLGTVRAACRQLGGHVTVESELGRGTTFAFFVPWNGATGGGTAVGPTGDGGSTESPRESSTAGANGYVEPTASRTD